MSEEKPHTAAKKIETAANIAIIIAAAAVLFFFVKNYMQKPAEPPTVALGSKFALQNVNWQSSAKNIVLAVSTTCHYCTESAPFYRQLVEQCKQQHVHTIAVLPQSVAEAQAYLQNEGVTVDDIRQAPLSDLSVGGTPTLVLVDSGGVVRDVWVGKQPDTKEKEILAKLTQ